MIAKLSAITALFFANKDVYSHDEIDIYKYGFELLFSTIINSACILLIAALMGIVFESVLFAAAFIPLRLSAGGYHAKHHWSCILSTNTIFFAFAMMLRYMYTNFMLPYILLSVTVSFLLIWKLSPVEAVNKPLSIDQRKKQRNRSITIAAINMTIVIASYMLPQIPVSIVAYYISGMLAASLSLIMGRLSLKQAF